MLWQGRAWVRAEDEQHQPHSQERAGAVTPPGGFHIYWGLLPHLWAVAIPKALPTQGVHAVALTAGSGR